MAQVCEEMGSNPTDAPFRYEEVASFIAGLVEDGILGPGTRAPSLRETSRERSVSLMTAMHAYRLLESRGVLEARPRSGYYVTRSTRASLPQPEKSNPPGFATNVAVSELVLKLLEYASNPQIVPLGCAVPSTALLDATSLDRCLSRAARAKGLHYNIYTEPQGDLALRLEIARRSMRWGPSITPDDVAITCGCTEALSLALTTVANPGDTIAVESPTYFGVLQVIEALNLKALELPTDPTNGVDLVALERALANHTITACLFSSSFNNPLGYTMSADRKRKVLELLSRHDVPLIEDDTYGEIYFGAERPKSFLSLDPNGDTIYCSSFSKTLAPGYRVGWIITRRYMRRAMQKKLAFSLCSPTLSQVALADFLSSGAFDRHLQRLKRTFLANVDRMRRSVERSFPRGSRVTRPEGGFVLWVEFPKPLNSRRLLERALARGICFAPGDVFPASGRFENCARLSCGYQWDARMERAVETIGALAGEMLRE